jgi:hypothetical protein
MNEGLNPRRREGEYNLVVDDNSRYGNLNDPKTNKYRTAFNIMMLAVTVGSPILGFVFRNPKESDPVVNSPQPSASVEGISAEQKGRVAAVVEGKSAVPEKKKVEVPKKAQVVGSHAAASASAILPSPIVVEPITLEAPMRIEGSYNYRNLPPNQLAVYYFGKSKAKVTAPWLWLLTTARRLGWKGDLKGSVSGLRTYEEQLEFFRISARGGNKAFNPDGDNVSKAHHLLPLTKFYGDSMMAVDVTEAEQLVEIAKKLHVHLTRPYNKPGMKKKEPWHVEVDCEVQKAVCGFSPPASWSVPKPDEIIVLDRFYDPGLNRLVSKPVKSR